MKNHLFVDNSNYWIEGMRVSAVMQKHPGAEDFDQAFRNRVLDQSFRVDFGKLLQFAGGSPDEIGTARLYGSVPPENDGLWAMARRHGFEVITHERGFDNTEKKVDTQMAADIVEAVFTQMQSDDELTLVSGDRDHVPALEKAQGRGIKVVVVSWKHCTSRELIDVADEFVDLTPQWQYFRL